MKKVIIIGDGGHARLVADIIEAAGKYSIAGYTSIDRTENRLYDHPLLGDDSILPELLEKGLTNVAIGIGGYRDNHLRKEIFMKAKSLGFNIITAIHPAAVISTRSTIEEGSVIFPGVIINNNVQIGKNSIVATGSTIDHDTVVEDHVLVSAGVTVGATVRIREGALIALGAKIISGLEIGGNVILGAGSVAVKNCIDPGTYLGIPAKKKM